MIRLNRALDEILDVPAAFLFLACVKILQSRMAVNAPVGIRSSTPNNMISMRPYYPPQPPVPPVAMKPYDTQSQASSGSGGGPSLTPTQSGGLHHHRVSFDSLR